MSPMFFRSDRTSIIVGFRDTYVDFHDQSLRFRRLAHTRKQLKGTSTSPQIMSDQETQTAISPGPTVLSGFPDELQRMIFEMAARRNGGCASRLVLLDRRVRTW